LLQLGVWQTLSVTGGIGGKVSQRQLYRCNQVVTDIIPTIHIPDWFPDFMLAHQALSHLKTEAAFQPIGEPVGNLTLGRGQLQGAPVHLAIVENRIASGSLGARESDRLASLFKVVAAQRSPLLMYLDSAGARVSEGLPALGAFRHMYRAALAMAASGAPVAAICAQLFCGASMLASLAGVRHFSANTRFAMSGPAILAQAPVCRCSMKCFRPCRTRPSAWMLVSSLAATMSPRRRSPDYRLPAAPAAAPRHAAQASVSPPCAAANLPPRSKRSSAGFCQALSRRLCRQPACRRADRRGHPPRRQGGPAGRDRRPVAGRGHRLGTGRCGVAKLASPPAALHVLVDCESHATSIDDERIMLSVYLADLAAALHALAAAGTRVETTVLGKLGGGVYVALAAPSEQVNLLYGKEIQLLPGRAIASILGDAGSTRFEFAEYQQARVADQELKLGLVD
jgi:hypothetical protein